MVKEYHEERTKNSMMIKALSDLRVDSKFDAKSGI